jgi:hypothetical protein
MSRHAIAPGSLKDGMHRIIAIRTALLLLASAGVASCAAPAPSSWYKPGAGEAAIAKDTAECRDAAEQEAELRYPRGFASPMLSGPGLAMAQQRDNTERANAVTAAFNGCMRERGYGREAK